MELKSRKRNSASGALSSFGKNVKESIKNESGGMGTFKLWINVASITLGFIFGGCHLVFGSYPLGIALVAAMPSSVWLSLLGVSLGALTLGRSGIIYAMISALCVLLRVIVSGSDKGSGTEGEIFSESISLRVSSAVISGFVAALYEILLEGLRLETVLFGLSMVVLPGVFAFSFAGAFAGGVGVRDLVFGTRRIFSSGESGRESFKTAYFKVSLAAFIALAGFSLRRYDMFGINLSFVFAGCITLFSAKRFGALYGAAAGFASAVFASGTYSPAYALLGLSSGALFATGVGYAVGAGGLLLSLWGSYAAGVSGFLSIFPEYLISLCITFPMFRFFEREIEDNDKEPTKRRASDMVGTMALAYRNREANASEQTEQAISAIIPLVSDFLVSEATAEDYNLFLKIIKEKKEAINKRREMDEDLTEKLEGVFKSSGFPSGIIRAFGDRRKYIICSGKDKDGTLITSPALKKGIADASGLKFAEPEYYRRAEMVVMECEATKKYKVSYAIASACGKSGEISGDVVKYFESKELFAHGIISDGMGSGDIAYNTSKFVSDFLENALSFGLSSNTALHMINSIIRRRADECSVALDVFSLDLITGEASFIKSGAASSYIKRKNALYRIKSETMPIGLIKQIDAERIKAETEAGDCVIMLSDGVSESAEETPWLVELLNKPIGDSLEQLAQKIIVEAKKNGRGADDMSALVMRIETA